MRRGFDLAVIAVLASAISGGAVEVPVTTEPIGRSMALPGAYQLALKQSESVAMKIDAIDAAEARIRQLRGAILPQISLNGSYGSQEALATASNFFPTNKYSTGVSLQQPLFAGFRDFAAYRQAKELHESAQFDRHFAESQLYRDVATAYLNLLTVQNEIRIRNKLADQLRERIAQLASWQTIGRSRKSEVLAAQADLAQAEAEIDQARATEDAAQETLKFLTGLSEDLLPTPMQDISVPTLEPYLARVKHRADVESARKQMEAAEESIRIAAGARWPTVLLGADYYPYRNGILETVHWDATVTASIPLFTGGSITAQIDQAQALWHATSEALALAQRSAEESVRAAYRSVVSQLRGVQSLEKADKLAEANVTAQTADYKLGLVTNIDVLATMDTLRTVRLALDAARNQALLTNIQLDVAAGGPFDSAQGRSEETK